MQPSAHSSAKQTGISIDWDSIDCVFLDMDGTLLDLNYDNHVWNDLVPEAYARRAGISLQQAQTQLLQHMREIRGSIEFYSFDYWIEYTGIDLVATHESATHLLAYRPGAQAFLAWLRASRHRSVIATNAHPDSIKVKDRHTDIRATVDDVVSSQKYAAPKEADTYWHNLFHEHPFDPGRCLFIDDNEPVLDAARHSGIGHLLAVATPDSSRPGRASLSYPSFDHFAEICPAISGVSADG